MTMRARPRPLLAGALVALGALLAACGGDDDTATTTTTTADEAVADTFVDADITFLQGMIPHHEGAVEMAGLVPDRTERPELLDLADEIVATQQDEIDRMEALLEEAGEPPADDGHHAAGMSEEGLEPLVELEGLAFDLAFTEMMIEHHQDAIDSAEEVLVSGRHAEVRRIATAIASAQQDEIDEMRQWQEEWRAEG